MRPIELYNSTPLAEALIEFKQVPIQKHTKPCPAFPKHQEPIIKDGDRWIVGLYPIIGYLDRRIPWPGFYPFEPEEYAKVAMVLDLFLKTPPTANDWLPIVQHSRFVLGDTSCVVDVILARLESDHPAWVDYVARVRAIPTARSRASETA